MHQHAHSLKNFGRILLSMKFEILKYKSMKYYLKVAKLTELTNNCSYLLFLLKKF